MTSSGTERSELEGTYESALRAIALRRFHIGWLSREYAECPHCIAFAALALGRPAVTRDLTAEEMEARGLQ